MRVLFLSCVGFVIKDVEVAVADLQEVNVAGDDVAFEAEVEPLGAIVGDVLASEVNGYFNGDGDGVVDEHEALQGFVALFVRGGSGEREGRKPCCVVFFPGDGWGKVGREFRGTVLRCLKEVVGEVFADAGEVALEWRKALVSGGSQQEF